MEQVEQKDAPIMANDMLRYIDKVNVREPLTVEAAAQLAYGELLHYLVHHDRMLRATAKAVIELNAKMKSVLYALDVAGINVVLDDTVGGAPVPQHVKMEQPTPVTAPTPVAATKPRPKRRPTNIEDYEAAMAYKESYDTGIMSVSAISKEINVPATTIRKYWTMSMEEASQLPKSSTMGGNTTTPQNPDEPEDDYNGEDEDIDS